jgi:tight adherence protein B
VNTSIWSALAFGFAGAAFALAIEDTAKRIRVRHRARQQVGLAANDPIVVRSGINTEVVRWVLISAACAVVPALFLGAPGLACGMVPVITRKSTVSRRSQKRSDEIAEELAPALQLIVGNLKIGRDVLSSLVDVSQAVAEPLHSILSDIVAEARVGVPLEQAVRHAAEREHERHLDIVASALSLQATHGGSLVEILQTVVETIEEEDRLRREIRSVTADGRLSSVVLLAMPPVVLAFVSVVSPGYASPLVTDHLGRTMSVIGVLLGLVGWRWLSALSHPKVVA